MKISKIEWSGKGWAEESYGYVQERNPLEEIDLLVKKINEIIDYLVDLKKRGDR